MLVADWGSSEWRGLTVDWKYEGQQVDGLTQAQLHALSRGWWPVLTDWVRIGLNMQSTSFCALVARVGAELCFQECSIQRSIEFGGLLGSLRY